MSLLRDNLEDRQNSLAIGQASKSGSLQMPGLVTQLSPTDQLSFPDTNPQPFGSLFLSGYGPSSSPTVTRPLSDPTTSPGVTRSLTGNTGVQTGALPSMRSSTTALRQPIVIRSTGKKSRGTMRPPKGRRWVIHLTVSTLLILIALVTLVTVIPAGTNGEGFNAFRPIVNWGFGGNSNPSLLAQQAATVTAVTQDGFQPGTGQNYSGLPTPPPGSNTYDGFTYGQCTYYADFRYHQLGGPWVPWGGDAWQWASGARAYGWNVSSTPHVPSIIVLQPYVQGASYFGHVAVVERVNPDGSVYTTNWNWYNNGGGWARWSWWDFRPGPGVSFVWK